MGIFFWKNKKFIDVFASELADELFSHVQPDVAKSYFVQQKAGAIKKSMKSSVGGNVERRIENLLLKVQQFRHQHKLGIYGKARLQMVFVARLEELGYEAEVVQQLNRMLLLQTA